MIQSNISKLFTTLSINLDRFVEEIINKKSNLMATDEWTVKDVLCHIVFWHESYAANYQSLANKQKPPLLEGPGYRLNQEGVSSFRKYSIKELIEKLHQAQNTLQICIVEKKVPQMTYKKEGRVYTTANFLDLVARHIHTHTKHTKRAK